MILGDGAFIGARVEVADGVVVGDGAMLSMSVSLGASTNARPPENSPVAGLASPAALPPD